MSQLASLRSYKKKCWVHGIVVTRSSVTAADFRSGIMLGSGLIAYSGVGGMTASHVLGRGVEEEENTSTGQQVQLRTLRYGD